MGEAKFRVLMDYTERKRFPEAPRYVPWGFAETFRAQAQANHDQTLERLNERGGLDPAEMYLAAHGRGLFQNGLGKPSVDAATAIAWLTGAVMAWQSDRRSTEARGRLTMTEGRKLAYKHLAESLRHHFPEKKEPDDVALVDSMIDAEQVKHLADYYDAIHGATERLNVVMAEARGKGRT